MANRFPLVLDTTDGNKIKEIPAGDNLDLRNVSIEDVQNINALGTINAAAVQINGENLKAGEFVDLTDVPNSYTGFEGYLVKVKDDASGLEFTTLGAGGTDFAVNDIILSGDIVPETLNTSNIGSTTKRFAQIHSQIFQGSLKGFDGSTVFDATTNQIPYAVIAGRPENVSDLPNDAEYITRAQLKATLPEVLGDDLTIEVNQTGNLQGSVFGEDSTILVDHINSRINAARLTQNGASDGQTIVWNQATQVWEPGIAGDITGLSSNKIDTLTVEAGYKFTFGDNPGLIEADGLSITTTTDPVNFDADIEIADGKSISPETDGEGSVGIVGARFGNGYFDALDVTTITGSLTGNADTATALATPITIAGVSFDGSANIDIAASDLSDTDQSLATTSDVEFNSVTGPIVTTSITGTTINITPSVEIVAGNLELTDDIYPDTTDTGKVGTSALKFAEGNFVTINSDTISVSSFSTTSISTEDLEVTGIGTGEITSGSDLVFTSGNRSRFVGGPVKVTTVSALGIDDIVAQNGDIIYNTTANNFQLYENGAWLGLHTGVFTGDVVGGVYFDDSTAIIDGLNKKVISPTVSGNATFENNVTISGNLTVQGSTTTIETTDTVIKDNLIILNDGEPGAGVTAGLSGIQVDRGSEANVSLFWDESNDYWSVGTGDFSATNITGQSGGDITQFTNITGDGGGTISGFTDITLDAGGTISGFQILTGIGGGDITQFLNITGDSGGDITQFLNITGDSGGTISQFTNITGDSGGSISQFTNITGDSGGDITQFTNITGDSGGTISQFTNITGDSGGDITQFTNITGDGGGVVSQFSFKGDLVASDDTTLVDFTTKTLTGSVVGSVTGDVTGDLKGSVVADDSTVIIDGVAGQIVGPINSTDGASSVTMSALGGLQLVSTAGVELSGAASAGVNIGIGTSGNVTMGNGSNTVQISVANLELDIANVPTSSVGQAGDREGMVAFDSTSIYYCIADHVAPGTADIWVKQDWGTTGSWS